MASRKKLIPLEVTPFKPARLIRFVDGSEIEGLACDFNAEKNLLKINRSVYDSASPKQQEQLFRARSSVSY